MKKHKKLPIGIQTFAEIRDVEQNYAYVDKTEICHNLIEQGKYFFLSRPRRFGKSLFLDTLSEIFKGSKGLFEGLYIYDKWDWSQTNPVIKIDLGHGILNSTEAVAHRLQSNLDLNAQLLGIEEKDYADKDVGEGFAKLIRSAHKKYGQRVVLLIDEYDKPIIDNISNKEMATEARALLRAFYSAIKSSDAHLRFVFMTGVSKFAKLNMFSGLNNLTDITISSQFATITGYTHNDLTTAFANHLEGVDLEEVRRWYNGYNYFGEPVYNPFDILQFFFNGKEYKNYWWETGNPKFLIDMLRQKPYYLPDLQNIIVDEQVLGAFDVEHIELPALLWQTGYLTFDRKVGDTFDNFYLMKVPNLEVQRSLNLLFFNYLSDITAGYAPIALRMKHAISNKNMGAFEKELKSLFASIPYHNYVKNNMGEYEGYYASVIYAFLSSLGFSVKAEDTTNKGRVDMALIGPAQILLLEFKVDEPAEDALHQIKTRRYFDKYTAENKPIYLIGIHFDSAQRNLSGFVWEEYR